MAVIPSELSMWTPRVVGALLNACSKRKSLQTGLLLHAWILKQEIWYKDVFVMNHLLNLYAKCRKMGLARQLFDEIPMRNTVTWTAMISGYNRGGNSEKGLELFSDMLQQDPSSPPNQFTYASALSACSNLECKPRGMQVHSHALRTGFVAHVLVSNVLISLYMACGLASEASQVFNEIHEPDQVSWNSLISGLAQNGSLETVLEKFHRMRESNMTLSSFSLSAAIVACSEDEIEGKKIHGVAVKTGLDPDTFAGSALVRMYSKFKSMVDACKAFRVLGFKDVASWNSLIGGYSENDQGERGLQVFGCLMESGPRPDEISMTAVLGICTSLATLECGKQVHSLCVKTGLDWSIRVENSMIDMYAKCGSLQCGLKIFRAMEKKSVVSWTAMMGGLAHHGRATEVLLLFEEMEREGLEPNKVTYTCVLSACGHGGLVKRGLSVFGSMVVEPEAEHYVCMVQLLAGGGRFEETEKFIEKAPVEFKELLWQSLLVACKNSGEWDKGLEIAEKVVRVDPTEEPLKLVLLSNIFASGGRWEEVQKLREVMRERGIKKEPGCSWIEVGNTVRVFGLKKQCGW